MRDIVILFSLYLLPTPVINVFIHNLILPTLTPEDILSLRDIPEELLIINVQQSIFNYNRNRTEENRQIMSECALFLSIKTSEQFSSNPEAYYRKGKGLLSVLDAAEKQRYS